MDLQPMKSPPHPQLSPQALQPPLVPAQGMIFNSSGWRHLRLWTIKLFHIRRNL